MQGLVVSVSLRSGYIAHGPLRDFVSSNNDVPPSYYPWQSGETASQRDARWLTDACSRTIYARCTAVVRYFLNNDLTVDDERRFCIGTALMVKALTTPENLFRDGDMNPDISLVKLVMLLKMSSVYTLDNHIPFAQVFCEDHMPVDAADKPHAMYTTALRIMEFAQNMKIALIQRLGGAPKAVHYAKTRKLGFTPNSLFNFYAHEMTEADPEMVAICNTRGSISKMRKYIRQFLFNYVAGEYCQFIVFPQPRPLRTKRRKTVKNIQF